MRATGQTALVEYVLYRAILILLIAAAGCSSTGDMSGHRTSEPRGQAIDIGTGLPVADVYLVVHYTTPPSLFVFPVLPHGESGGCHSFFYEVTSRDGYYHVPRDVGRETNWHVYKKGYEIVAPPGRIERHLELVGGHEETRYHVLPSDPAVTYGMREGVYTTDLEARHAAGRDNTYLKPFVGTATERLKSLVSTFYNADCMWSGDDRKNVVPFLQVVYLEAESLPVSGKDAEIVRGMAGHIKQMKTAR